MGGKFRAGGDTCAAPFGEAWEVLSHPIKLVAAAPVAIPDSAERREIAMSSLQILLSLCTKSRNHNTELTLSVYLLVILVILLVYHR